MLLILGFSLVYSHCITIGWSVEVEDVRMLLEKLCEFGRRELAHVILVKNGRRGERIKKVILLNWLLPNIRHALRIVDVDEITKAVIRHTSFLFYYWNLNVFLLHRRLIIYDVS